MTQQTQSSGLFNISRQLGNLFVWTAFYAGAHHVCMSSHAQCRHTRHGDEIHGVRVLEEEDVIQVVLLQPLINYMVLTVNVKKMHLYAVQA